jgi:hypothetical protein
MPSVFFSSFWGSGKWPCDFDKRIDAVAFYPASKARKLTSAIFFLDETRDGICQSLRQQAEISGLCRVALPLALLGF